MDVLENSKGNYRFVAGIGPYSKGVAALPGFEIIHVAFHTPPPYRKGFEIAEQHLSGEGRDLHALCAIELRSPAPFTFDGFTEFNKPYQELLAKHGLLVGEYNPIARTNVAPAVNSPAEAVLAGFSYTVPASGKVPLSLVTAGAGDLHDQALSQNAIVRGGETSDDAYTEKARHVTLETGARVTALGGTWTDVTDLNVYTILPVNVFLKSVILETAGGAATMQGIRWLYCRPPITGVEYEMDARSVRKEIRLR